MASAVEVCGLKPLAPVARTVVNPAYLTAQYEDVVIFANTAPHWLMEHVQNTDLKSGPPSRRYNFEDGQWVSVPYYTTEYS